MASAKLVGRGIGLTLLFQALATRQIYFSLLPPVTASTFLTTAAPHATSIRIALVLSIVLSILNFGVALAVLPIARPRTERLAIAYVGVTVMGVAAVAAETLGFRNLLALSLEYAKPAAPHDVLQSIGAAAHSTAILTHFTNLVFGHTSMLLLYLILLRLALVPRVIPIAGIIASVIGIVDVALPLLGGHFSFLYVLPAGLSLLALIVWLLAKGLADHSKTGNARQQERLDQDTIRSNG